MGDGGGGEGVGSLKLRIQNHKKIFLHSNTPQRAAGTVADHKKTHLHADTPRRAAGTVADMSAIRPLGTQKHLDIWSSCIRGRPIHRTDLRRRGGSRQGLHQRRAFLNRQKT